MIISKLAVTGPEYRLVVILAVLPPDRVTVQYSYGASMGIWKQRLKKIRKYLRKILLFKN